MLVQYRDPELLKEPKLTKDEEDEIKIFGRLFGRNKSAIEDNVQYRVLAVITSLTSSVDGQGSCRALVMKRPLNVEEMRSGENWPIFLPFSKVEVIDDTIPDNWETIFRTNMSDGVLSCLNISSPAGILDAVHQFGGYIPKYIYICAENTIDEKMRKVMSDYLMLHLLQNQRQKEICACRILDIVGNVRYLEDMGDKVSGELLEIYKETLERNYYEMHLALYPQWYIVERLLSIPVRDLSISIRKVSI